jgi:hypothetical protein
MLTSADAARGLVPDSLMPLTGNAAGLARTLRSSPLVSLTAGELYGRRIDVRADAAIARTIGCELVVLTRRLASERCTPGRSSIRDRRMDQI